MAVVGQWWETRKQTTIIAAEFEERRLLWCSDLLATMAAEVTDGGELRADTCRLLERELRRTIAVLLKNAKADVPYSFVLQCERASRALVSLNHVMNSELRHARAAERDVAVPDYVPFDRLRVLLPTSEKSGIMDALRRLLPGIFGTGEDDPLAESLRNTKKDPQLAGLEDLALELRSAELHLDALEALPNTLREPPPDEEVLELEGVAKLAARLGAPQLPGAG